MRKAPLIPEILFVLIILAESAFPEGNFEHYIKNKPTVCSQPGFKTETKISKLDKIPSGKLPYGIDYITDQCWQVYLPRKTTNQPKTLRFNYSGICGCWDEKQLVLLKRSSYQKSWQLLTDNVTFDYRDDLSDGIGSVKAIEVARDSMLQFAIARKSYFWPPNIPRNITAHVVYGPVRLQWETVCEIDNKGYVIERKTAESRWTKVGAIDALRISVFPQFYQFDDLSRIEPGTKLLYRIKQIDQCRKIAISPPIQVFYTTDPINSALSSALMRANENCLDISYRTHFRGKVLLEIYSNSGRLSRSLVNKTQEKGSHSVIWDFKESEIKAEEFFNGYCKLILKSKTDSRSFIHIQDIILK